ncbi:YhbY family RNA-binding protein [uncultured Dialister sp.]|uniref:YhbY family RNA-binding protein n=1 Tax=uncultured Dialister sp. TaxID=278064 RepID=UPI0025CC81E3|nr:YhbY family RNA-binding protein [uncultured Dialister sp.]
MMLTGKQKQYLKSLAVQLPAYVQIGKEGITETVVGSVKDVLLARELVKVKINQNSDEDIHSTATLLASKLECEIVQIIGRNCVLFKQKEKKSHYELP